MGKSLMEKLDDFLALEVHFTKPYLRESQKIPCPECPLNLTAPNNEILQRKVSSHMKRAHNNR